MKLICVGGLSSGCGKTSVACLLLKALPGWGAMKVTPSRSDDVCPRGQDCEACQPPEGPYYVAIDSDIPERPGPVPIISGTDTSRFRDAGASHVAFVRALPECLPIALEYAFERLSDLPGVIVETTTAMPLIDGLRILVARQGRTEVKDSAHTAAGLADILAVNQDADDPPVPIISGSEDFFSDFPFAAGLPIKCITVCACLPPEHSCNQELIAECRLFLKC